MNRPDGPGTKTALRPRPTGAALSRKSLDLARNFLSALFMGVRTAQIHDPSNRAFENGVQMVHRAAEALYASTGGFSVQFVEDSAFLNGTRLRFEGGTFASMRTLRRLLESQGLGGIEMKSSPSHEAVRKLILLFSPKVQSTEAVSRDELAKDDIGVLGVQRFADGKREMRVDRRIFAVQCYAKLLLALREQLERAARERTADWGVSHGPPRLRAVRVIQDLIELCGDRADFLLRMAFNATGAAQVELLGVNGCVLSIALGHALQLERHDLVDLAVAALFSPIGAPTRADGRIVLGPQVLHASVGRLLGEGGVGRVSYTRALVIGEQALLLEGRRDRVHLYARLVTVATAFVQLVGGFGEEGTPPLHPLDALARLHNDGGVRFDTDLVDLLMNVLRAYPVGCEVTLESGAAAVVTSHAGGSRWDRPLVSVDSSPPRVFDLMLREDGRFVDRIVGTRRFLGAPESGMQVLAESHAAPALDAAALLDVLEGEDVIPEEAPPILELSPDLLDPADAPYLPASSLIPFDDGEAADPSAFDPLDQASPDERYEIPELPLEELFPAEEALGEPALGEAEARAERSDRVGSAPQRPGPNDEDWRALLAEGFEPERLGRRRDILDSDTDPGGDAHDTQDL